VGPSLSGAGFAAIADTDAGVLDGDARWDHAVGPMQFIPSTWQPCMAGWARALAGDLDARRLERWRRRHDPTVPRG
jgi:membrane-bound lytic murein transglycosylase B